MTKGQWDPRVDIQITFLVVTRMKEIDSNVTPSARKVTLTSLISQINQHWYTYHSYLPNNLALRDYIREGMSLLHGRVIFLFDLLKDKYHRCIMDNLYNSKTFCRQAYNHVKKVLCYGVKMKGLRGIPSCVIQEKMKS